MMRSVYLAAAVIVLSAGMSRADELELHDGRVIVGLVKSQTANVIVFEVHAHGSTMEMTFRTSEVRKVTRKPLPQPTTTTAPPVQPKPPVVAKPVPPADTQPDGPKYFLLPMKGVVGKELSAAKMREALAKGLTDSEIVLVLEMDSPGGLLSECEEIIKLLSEHRDRRSIAFIKSAYSAAAIISLTCDEIYMQNTASIGAALAFQNTPWGRTAVEEKFQSVWRAMCRSAADIGGHNPLIAEAMVDSSMRLKIVQKDGKPDVEQFSRLVESDLTKGDILASGGKLLTMTARESVRCGLAVAIADNMDKVGELAGLAGWKSASRAGEDIMNGYAKEITEAEKLLTKYKDDFEKAMTMAEANDPDRGRYYVNSFGQLSADSKQEFLQRSKRCAECLKGAEDRCKKIMELAEKYPFFASDGEEAKSYKNRIEAFRKEIQNAARRYGL